MHARPEEQAMGWITTWKARSVSRSRRGVLPRRLSRRIGRVKPSRSYAWPLKMPAIMTRLCRSAGRGGAGLPSLIYGRLPKAHHISVVHCSARSVLVRSREVRTSGSTRGEWVALTASPSLPLYPPGKCDRLDKCLERVTKTAPAVPPRPRSIRRRPLPPRLRRLPAWRQSPGRKPPKGARPRLVIHRSVAGCLKKYELANAAVATHPIVSSFIRPPISRWPRRSQSCR